jgi:hypothetical protein
MRERFHVWRVMLACGCSSGNCMKIREVAWKLFEKKSGGKKK